MDDSPRQTTVSPLRLNRRRLVQGASVGAAAALPARMLSASDRKLAWNLWQEENPEATPETVEDYEPVALSTDEWTTLTAVVDRLFPETDETPSGSETGAHIYIDRMLRSPDPVRFAAYRSGTGATISDYQAGLAAIEAAIDDGFSNASDDEQDDALKDVEAGKIRDVPDGFFDALIDHTRQGMFCDPIHGGNREFMGWDMIGYPGIKLLWTAEEQAIDTQVEPVHVSVEEYGGTAQ